MVVLIATRRHKILPAVCLALLIAWAGSAWGQGAKTFTGKITEIAKGTQLDLGKSDIYYTLRLAEYHNISFRLTVDDAARFGLIDKSGVSGVPTPKMSKGVGWKVRLTCDPKNLGENKAPVYKVTSLTKLDD